MSDFYKIKRLMPKPGILEVFPDFQNLKSKDLMVRGGKFYAVWDEDTGLWNQNEDRVREIVDNDINEYVKKIGDIPGVEVRPKFMLSDSSGIWKRYRKYVIERPDNFHQLDEQIAFSDTGVTKKDYVSKRLPYPLVEGDHSAWDEMVGTLYFPEEREKIEWAIGAVISGDSKTIQKFLVFYGDPGTGKGTILDIVKELFDSYAVSFDSGELTGFGNSFPMEQFRTNPLVAIQFDGDLSRIADNTKLNSLVSHEPMVMKEKYKQPYDFIPHCFLFLASNHPVKITDAKSGIIRRLIDVRPSLQKIPVKRYFQLKNQISFELGAIAAHCLQVYQEMGKHYYDGYRPVDMMFKTDAFFNFVDFHYLIFSRDDGVSLKSAYEMYKDYCDTSNIQRLPMYKFREELKNYFENFEPVAEIDGTRVRSWYSGFDRTKFEIVQKGEADGSTGLDRGQGNRGDGSVSRDNSSNGTGGNRGSEVHPGSSQGEHSIASSSGRSSDERTGTGDNAGGREGCSDQNNGKDTGNSGSVSGTDSETDGDLVHTYGTGRGDGPDITPASVAELPEWLRLGCSVSILDKILSAQPAQYSDEEGKPGKKWAEVLTKLKDIVTSKEHYVQVPFNHIIIDFDLKDENGNKCLQKCLEAAALWKPTYAEVSKGGNGLHLHYIYDGDPQELAREFAPGIEIKRVAGNGTLHKDRRKVSRCNDIPIAHLSSGLPRKEAKKTVNFDAVRSEKGLRDLIERNLRKEIHPGTKPSIDFIEKILSDAYESDLKYDVSDMQPEIMDFAIHSSHQADYCLTKVAKMKFHSDDISDASNEYQDDRLVFFDLEVFPNLVLVNWKFAGDDHCQRMINPKPHEIEALMKYKLVGFNCRRYDNHILYAIYIGKTIPEIYDISQGIINNSKNCTFGEAYNISYTDVYDFCSKKQSLKKWEIQLGIHHQELGLPWDQPVPESKWLQVAEYCDNDVFATEAVFNDRQADWIARQILADLAGMTVNDTTNSLTTRIIFGKEKHPQLNYRFLGIYNSRELEDMHERNPKSTIIDLYDFNGDLCKVDLYRYYKANRDAVETGTPYRMQNENHTFFDELGRPVFPGYYFENGKSYYRGEEVGEGGYVFGVEGIHVNVPLLDITSMHPTSAEQENLFCDHTKNFSDIKQTRIYIKHGEYDKAKELFGGKLAKYLEDPAQAKALSGALKIAINSVYGLTSAKFENAFHDKRNIDNIVAKRGALFMINLKNEVLKRGYTVAHIKTDSIKVANGDRKIIDFVMDYGKLYGYIFEHEATYERMCLVNKAVYIARYADGPHKYEFSNGLKGESEWTATGDQFIEPYVFKSLFSKEPIRFKDLTQTFSCTSALYLDMNENMPDVSAEEKEYDKLRSKVRKLFKEMKEACDVSEEEWRTADEWHSHKPECSDNWMNRLYSDPILEAEHRMKELTELIANGHNYVFIGKVGLFAPVKSGIGGGLLMREKDGKMYAAGGTIGYRWIEAETVHDHLEDVVDMSFFINLDDAAIDAINQYGDFYDFIDLSGCSNAGLPWQHTPVCGETSYENCLDCPHWRIRLDQENYEEMFQCDKI